MFIWVVHDAKKYQTIVCLFILSGWIDCQAFSEKSSMLDCTIAHNLMVTEKTKRDAQVPIASLLVT